MVKYFLLFIALTFSACGVTVYSESSDNVNFSEYKTFAWLPPLPGNAAPPEFNVDTVASKVIGFSNTELKSKGLTIDTINPDLLLEYFIAVDSNSVTHNIKTGEYTYTSFPGCFVRRPVTKMTLYRYREMISNYQEGVLLIQATDFKKKRVVWRSWAKGIHPDSDLYLYTIQPDVKRIFKKYPVESRK